jgi:hypothetical protein
MKKLDVRMLNYIKKMDMRLGTWNIRSLYRAGSLVTVSKELSKYKLEFSENAGSQMGRW